MTIQTTLSITAGLIGIVLFISSFEFLFLGSQKKFNSVWSFENLKSELQLNLPLPNFLIRILFSNSSFNIMNAVMLMLTLFLLYKNSVVTVLAMFIMHLLICIRFRGTFNGGSDMMIVVILTGLIISLANPDWEKAGVIYIAIHTLYSYFKAGLVKLRSSEWRNGTALPLLLSRSQIGFTKNFAEYLQDQKPIARMLSWAVILFEVSTVLLLIMPQLKLFYFCGAVLFHFTVYLGYGLNRFFWVWLAAWPATFFFLSTLK